MLANAREEFDASAGCYLGPEGDEKRIAVVGEEEAAVEAAGDWLGEQL